MKKMIAFLIVCFLLIGCESVSQKQDMLVRQGVYATKDSIEVGRIDLAKVYIDNTSKLLAPPDVKKRIKVSPAKNQQYGFVVLPKHLVGKKVVVASSSEWDSLIKNSKELQKQIEQEQQTYQKYEEKVNKTLVEKEELIQKLQAENQKYKKSSWFGWVFKSLGVLLPLGGIGLVVACVFNPALIPIVLSIFSTVVEIIGRFIYGIVSFVKMIIEWVQSFRAKK